jgi:hypothetical protein
MTDARREMFGYLSEAAGILASASRIELVDLLAQGERSVEELAEASHLSVASSVGAGLWFRPLSGHIVAAATGRLG